MKVAHKLTTAFVIGVLVVHGVSAAVTIAREKRQVHGDIERRERILGRSLSRSVSRIWKAFGEAEALSLIDESNERHDAQIRWIWLDASPGDGHAATMPPGVIAPIVHGDVVFTSDRGAVYTYAPTPVPGGRIGALEISESLDDERAYLQESMLFVLITAGALVLCCSVLAWVLGIKLIGRPVGLLLKYASRVENGDLTQRLAPRSRDELGELSVALSHMCDGLERARDRVEAETRAKVETIEQLRHADRLATVGTLAAGVAHELGTPINVIEGHAQLIREDRAANETIIRNSTVITKQCKRMASIIHDLLRFARRTAPTASTVDVGEVARETIRMCEVLMHKQDVTATIDDTGELVGRIAADPMQQILTNVIMNGIQAMPRGGALSLHLTRERVRPPDQESEAEFVRIRVADTGVGMDEATRRRIFEPFFTTKDVGEGTGLGLSVALGIAIDHDGWIEVASQPGAGSAVSIFIPLQAPEATP
jgi:signal transduction histidine kinase